MDTSIRADVCSGRGCDYPLFLYSYDRVKQGDALDLVITNSPRTKPPESPESSHPIHLRFYVAEVGYPNYHSNGTYYSPSDDIECIVEGTDKYCDHFIAVEQQVNGKLMQKQIVR